MKISQLVENKIKTPYHESLASRLPRGIKTQQQLFKLGYRIAVEDLGLAKAKTLNENFAAKLVNSYHTQSLNEGVGSFLGRAAGNVVGGAGAAWRGLKGAWSDAKKGYADAKAGWDPSTGTAPPASAPAAVGGSTAAPAASGTATAGASEPAASGAAPAAAPATEPAPAKPSADAAPLPGGATPTPPAAGTPPKTSGSGVSDIMKAIDGLDPASKKQLAGELEKNINAAPATPAAAPAAAPATPAAAPAAPQGQALDLDQLKKDREAKQAAGVAGQQQAQQQMAATAKANAATSQQDAAIKAAADAAKAKSGFQQTAADKLAIKQAADRGIREEDEIAEGFHSNFLGMKI